MEFKYSYQFTRRTADDLDEIIRYLSVELAAPSAAAEFVNRLQKMIEEMRLFPESGARAVNDLLPDLGVRKKIVGNYVLYYLPDTDKKMLMILRIISCRRSTDEIWRTFSFDLGNGKDN